jgi:hypothetical protein
MLNMQNELIVLNHYTEMKSEANNNGNQNKF